MQPLDSNGTVIGFGLAVLAFVVAVLVQTAVVWIAFAVIVVATFFCLLQLAFP